MTRPPIGPITLEPCFSAATRKAAEKLNEWIAAHNGNLQRAQQRRADLLAKPILDVGTEDLLNQSLVEPADAFKLIQDELSVRCSLATFFEMRRADWQLAEQAAFTKVETEKAHLEDQLKRLGFVFPFDSRVPGAIPPAAILNHPRVRAARDEHATMQARLRDTDLDQANRAAIDDLTATLEKLRGQALGSR